MNIFQEKTSAFNLAVFRIIFYAYLLLSLNSGQILWFSNLPVDLQFAPDDMGRLLGIIPVNPDMAAKALYIFRVLCLMGLTGCCARSASFWAGLVGIYVLGIVNFYGKVNHDQIFLIWFMFIFSVSNCAEVLSIDAVFKAIREADRGIEWKNLPAVEYAMPLRFVWLLMGLIYFFPGLWKLVHGHLHWAFSDNFKYQLYDQWARMGWVPALRIDHYPLLCHLAALGAMCFELSFVFLVLFPALRWVPFIAGLVFHTVTYFLMRIAFFALQMCYASFIDWDRIFKLIGTGIFKRPLYLIYDGNCTLCQRTIAVFRKFDVFQRIVYINAFDKPGLSSAGLQGIDHQDLMRDMRAVVGGGQWEGYYAYRKLALRIPILWPLWPLLWLCPVPRIGVLVYRRIADSRACRVPVVKAAQGLPSRPADLRPLRWTGIFLLTVNCIGGIKEDVSAWPFACFPPFDYMIPQPKMRTLSLFGFKDGREERVDLSVVRDRMGAPRYDGLLRSILGIKDRQQQMVRLKGFLHLVRSEGIDLKKYSGLFVYEIICSTLPDIAHDNIVSRKLLARIDI